MPKKEHQTNILDRWSTLATQYIYSTTSIYTLKGGAGAYLHTRRANSKAAPNYHSKKNKLHYIKTSITLQRACRLLLANPNKHPVYSFSPKIRKLLFTKNGHSKKETHTLLPRIKEKSGPNKLINSKNTLNIYQVPGRCLSM